MASGVGIFFGILILLVVLGGGGYIAWTRIRAKRLGLPPPPLNPFASRGSRSAMGASDGYAAPAPGGVLGWINDKISGLKNKRGGGGSGGNTRYAAGAYEESGGATAAARGRGRGTLDPDEAWDSRVGNEADYGYGYEEEQELGLRDPHHHAASANPYGGGGYAPTGYVAHTPGIGGPERGRSRTRELDERYEEEMHGGGYGHGGPGGSNPFGDNAERSDIHSLRGVSPRPIDTSVGRSNGGKQSSPTESRRSIFREDM